jgi:probable rRNA maturation factor
MQQLSRRERAGRDVRSHKTICTKTLGTKTFGSKTLGTKILCTMPHSIIPMTEVLVVADCWQDEPEAEAVIQRAIAAAAETVDADVGDAELAVMLTDDGGIRTLNSNWRGIDKPTNVLSFPALQPTAAPQVGDAPRMLGDIAIAYETLRKEADDEGKRFDHHLSHLAVHGFLHLIGYDHEQDDQAEAMEALEREILAQLGIPDPYADRERMD